MKYSIIFPVFNEQENIDSLYNKTKKALDTLGSDYEFIFINDGSTDATAHLLTELNKKDKKVKFLNLSRNFGHQAAVAAGLKFAKGESVAILDGDLQDPPDILPTFFSKLDAGYDAVYAIRKNRKESFLKRAAYSLFYRFLRRVANIDIPLDSGDFCVMNQKVVRALNSLPERNRFIRGLRSWVGFKQIGLEYERDARAAGKSKYSFTKLIKLAFDGIFSFSYVPLQIMFYFGLISLFLSVLGTLFAIYNKFFTNNYVKVPGFATTIILVMFVGGLNMFALGLIGEYMRRIYDETKARPPYVIDDMIGIDKN